MIRLLPCVALLLLLSATSRAPAQEATGAANLQERRRGASDDAYYLDREASARLAIHRRAAWKAAQRQQRLEMYKWYGYSPLRPPGGAYPFLGAVHPRTGPVVYYNYPGVFFPRAGFVP